MFAVGTCRGGSLVAGEPSQHAANVLGLPDTLMQRMKPKGAVLTVIAKNYLAHARCLMDSVATFHPDLSRFVILADTVDGYFDPAQEAFEVILSDKLAIPNAKWFHFKYTLLELCTALKPYAIEHLFSVYELDYVLYLDPDILVCGALDSLLERLEDDSLVLTPHITEPLRISSRPSELDILRAGTYNAGFLGVRRCDEALAFVQWWKNRLYEYCVIDLPRGLFVDQRWIDFAPSFVARLSIVRDTSYNVAYWNLSQREISLSGGGFYINGRPLGFFHFSGFDPYETDRLSKHQPDFRLSKCTALGQLTQEYGRLLLDHGHGSCRSWPYAYGCFRNGIEIPELGRSLHYECPESMATIADPFSDDGFREFVRIWNEPMEIGGGAQPLLTRMAYKVYRTRSDLQAAMPDVFNGDYRKFLGWLTSKGTGAGGLPDVFLAPFRGLPEAPVASDSHSPVDSGSAPVSPDISEALFERSTRSSVQAITEDMPVALTNAAGTAGLRLPRLALEIHARRPDLQAFFPDYCGRDSVKYLVWLLSYGRREYIKSKVLSAALRRQWAAVLASLPSAWLRLRYRGLLGMAIIAAASGPLLGRVVRIGLCQRIFQKFSGDATR